MSRFSDAMKVLRESEAYIQREKRRAAVRKNMDALVAAQWSLKDLQELFGRAMFAKLRETPTRHQLPGKHSGKHYARIKHVEGMKDEDEEVSCFAADHPAGTKLVRRFIRRGNSENTAMRQKYAQLTGHQYGGAA